MKKQLFLLLLALGLTLSGKAQKHNFAPSSLYTSMQKGDKLAVLMVHFGTTHDDTRALTIEAINEKVKTTHPGIAMREAYTSRIVMRRLKARGVTKLTPEEALQQLHAEGFTHVLIQSTNIIEGVEMESLRREVAEAQPLFKEIRVGTPLLYHPSDYEKVIEALMNRLPQTTDAIVLVGHGTYTPATATYAMMDYMLKAKGHRNVHVGTIEGYPSFDDLLTQLRATQAKSVLLAPLMFVAGEHAKNDIADEWKTELEKAGYVVTVFTEGLGENPGIQELFIDHLRFAEANKHLDIMEKKATYAIEKD